jgi:site-specific recombinase XerD
MFEQLFEHPRALTGQQSGPLAEERRRFLVHCAELQMARRTLRGIAQVTLLVARVLRLADRPGELITRAEIQAEADRWAQRPLRPPAVPDTRRTSRRFSRHAARWRASLGRWPPPPLRYPGHVARFADHRLQERGLSPRTAEYRCRMVPQFLAGIDDAGLARAALTSPQVDQQLARMAHDGGYARTSVRTHASALRAFFRYAEACGWCRPGLAIAILAPRAFPHAALPAGPSWDDVNRLLAAAQGDRPVDGRDRALLLRRAVHGLRAGEVVRLRREDFDGERERLTIPHSKGQRPRTSPLVRPVGDAILRYLRDVRPRAPRREVLLTPSAPLRPLRRGALGQVVRWRLRALGLILPPTAPMPCGMPARPTCWHGACR